MQTIKLLHTSDIHLDWPFEGFAEGARAKRRADLFAAFSSVCRLAVSEGVRGLLISGDLFHSDRVDRQTAAFAAYEFTNLMAAGIQVVVLPGNHDPGVGDVLCKNGGLPDNVFVFRGDSWQEYRGIEGVTIYGFPYNTARSRENVLTGINAFTNAGFQAGLPEGAAREGFAVGMLHASLNGLPHVEGEYYPIGVEDISQCGFDYLALGHYHNYRDCSSGDTLCFYPGSPERLTFHNLSDRKAVIVTMGSGRPAAETVTIPARKYITMDVDLNGQDLAEVYRKLNKLEDREACLRVNITGVTEHGSPISAPFLEEQLRDRFFNIEICDNTTVIPEADPADKTVRGIFIKRLRAELEDESLSESRKQVLNEALRVGLAALEGGKL